MKKILFFICCSLFFCSSYANADDEKTSEEKFLNPIFYEKMASTDFSDYEVWLTPTSIRTASVSPNDYSCKLIDNRMFEIKLKCTRKNWEGKEEPPVVITYTLRPCIGENYCLDKGAWFVDRKITPSEHNEIATYIIPSKVTDAPKDKFVNPMFYKKLSPLSTASRTTFLTPTLLTYLDLYGEKVYQECEMLENTPMFVTLSCLEDGADGHKFNLVTRYILQRCNGKEQYCFEGEWIVLKRTKFSGGVFIVEEEDMGQ